MRDSGSGGERIEAIRSGEVIVAAWVWDRPVRRGVGCKWGGKGGGGGGGGAGGGRGGGGGSTLEL